MLLLPYFTLAETYRSDAFVEKLGIRFVHRFKVAHVS